VACSALVSRNDCCYLFTQYFPCRSWQGILVQMAVCVIFVMDHCSNRKTFSSTPQCSTKFLYYDDLEICNPLGSNVKKHKLGHAACNMVSHNVVLY
jgi:hypothetical protein